MSDGNHECLDLLEDRLRKELTPEERRQQAHDEQYQRLIHLLDDMETQIGLRLQGLDSHIGRIVEQSKGTARRIKEMYELMCGLVVAGLLLLVCNLLAKTVGEWVYSSVLVTYVGYTAFWLWRHIIRDT